MKIRIDDKNQAIICTGYYKGKKIKAVSIYKPEDKFDIEFGIRLTKEKYKLKKLEHRKNMYTSNIRHIEKVIQNLSSKAFDNLKDIRNKIDDINNIVKTKYND